MCGSRCSPSHSLELLVGLTQKQFAEMVDKLPHKLPAEYLEHLYKLCDQDGNDRQDCSPLRFSQTLLLSHPCSVVFHDVTYLVACSLDFREVCCWLSVLTRGSLSERLKLCFDLYDVDQVHLAYSAFQ